MIKCFLYSVGVYVCCNMLLLGTLLKVIVFKLLIRDYKKLRLHYVLLFYRHYVEGYILSFQTNKVNLLSQ